MTDGNDVFERNLERLIRPAALPPPDPERARRLFLARVEDRAPFDARMARRIAMAAALMLAAALLYSALAPQAKVQPQAPGRPKDDVAAEATPPRNDPPADPRPALSKVTPQETPPGPAAPVQAAKNGDMTLACTFPPPRAKNPQMKIEGSAPYPDGAELALTVYRAAEQFAGGRLVAVQERTVGGLARMEGRKFETPLSWSGPGGYLVTVVLAESQRPGLVGPLQRFPRQPATFEFAGWGDELVAQLGPKLQEIDLLARECLDQVERIETLASKESTWIKERKNVDPRGADLVLTKEAEEVLKAASRILARLERSDLTLYFPATLNEMHYTLRAATGNAQHFVYEQGKFAGTKSYHFPGEKVKTHRGDAFDFNALKRYLAEAGPLGGREMSLWLVKDLRRTGGQRRPDITDALKVYGPHPGLAPVADRLGKAALPDLDGLEKEIRSAP
jgi:hypothetical protein